MKTKEIDVWVPNFIEEDFGLECIIANTGVYASICGDQMEEDNIIYYRAKLIIEIPEKKIEITESEFDKLAESYMTLNCYGVKKVYYDDLKKELFGDDVLG